MDVLNKCSPKEYVTTFARLFNVIFFYFCWHIWISRTLFVCDRDNGKCQDYVYVK